MYAGAVHVTTAAWADVAGINTAVEPNADNPATTTAHLFPIRSRPLYVEPGGSVPEQKHKAAGSNNQALVKEPSHTVATWVVTPGREIVRMRVEPGLDPPSTRKLWPRRSSVISCTPVPQAIPLPGRLATSASPMARSPSWTASPARPPAPTPPRSELERWRSMQQAGFAVVGIDNPEQRVFTNGDGTVAHRHDVLRNWILPLNISGVDHRWKGAGVQQRRKQMADQARAWRPAA